MIVTVLPWGHMVLLLVDINNFYILVNITSHNAIQKCVKNLPRDCHLDIMSFYIFVTAKVCPCPTPICKTSYITIITSHNAKPCYIYLTIISIISHS